MSKTVDLQVEKAQSVLEGLRRNHDLLNGKGIRLDGLDELATSAEKVVEASKACDALRAEYSQQVKLTNQLLDALKSNYAKYREIIRSNFPQEQWINFGLQDKR